MVTNYGVWKEEKDYSVYPKNKWCDFDYLAAWIREQNYEPETSMENLIHMIILYFDCPDNFGEYDEETGFGGYGECFTIEGCKQYVLDSGGLKEFDYYC